MQELSRSDIAKILNDGGTVWTWLVDDKAVPAKVSMKHNRHLIDRLGNYQWETYDNYWFAYAFCQKWNAAINSI